MVPFFSLDTLAPPQLISIGNFLRSELSTLSHAVKYYSRQYEFVQQQLEDVNRAHMAKLAISDGPGPSADTAPVAGPSKIHGTASEDTNEATTNLLDM